MIRQSFDESAWEGLIAYHKNRDPLWCLYLQAARLYHRLRKAKAPALTIERARNRMNRRKQGWGN